VSAASVSRELDVGGVRLVHLSVQGTRSDGLPFLFQHGMGGDADQPLSYVGDSPPTRVIALNARGHAPSSDITPDTASFDRFADDVIALADSLDLPEFIVGGISLGAGTALNVTLRYPDRVAGLVLCRPAWLDRPQAELNRAAYAEIADLLDAHPADAAQRYPESTTYQSVRRTSPAAAASLLGQLTRPRAAENALVLRAFPGSSPTSSADAWRDVGVPTLVIGHHGDPFHAYDIATAYADAIRGAKLCTVPSKDDDQAGFATAIHAALHQFLHRGNAD
jgi:pimeloyl-ACP methyl ester carboxylesterase